MQARVSLIVVIILVSLAACSFGQEAAKSPEKVVSPNDVNATIAISFPYVAEIAGDDVYIRSGPGTNYYNCGKLRRGDRIQVVSTQFNWSRIVPLPGSFSWISNQYVSVDPNNPNVGIVTGDNVRVYAGSDFVRPIHSTTLQLKLIRGDKVKLLGEEQENYYKIAAPAGAYLWVSNEYVKPLGPVGQLPVVVEVKVGPNDVTVAALPKASVEEQKLKEYYELEKRLQAERAKPIGQQDYAGIKKGFAGIAANKEAGKAARFAEFLLKQVERFELAGVVSKEVQLQESQLQQTRERIDKARTARLSKLEELGKFAVIGQLKSSSIFGAEPQLRHYRIADESGKTICYAFPVGQAAAADFNKFTDRKVGLIGVLEAHPQTGKALVKFTELVELK